MIVSDEPRLADHQGTFLRHLSRRVEVIGRRLQRFSQLGWDINGLFLIYQDAQRLAEGSARHGADTAGAQLLEMVALLKNTITEQTLPDPALGERLTQLINSIATAVPQASNSMVETTGPRVVGNTFRAEIPPPAYWHRWTEDAPPAVPEPQDDYAEPPVLAGPEPDLWGDTVRLFGEPPSTPAALDSRPIVITAQTATFAVPLPAVAINAMPEPVASVATVPAVAAAPVVVNQLFRLSMPAGYRIYHLTGHGPLSLELDQRLEAQGVEVELLETMEELQELLNALPTDLVLIDASFASKLEDVGEIVRQARERSSKRVLLMAISDTDSFVVRLSGRRAGVDALVVGPNSVNDVLKRMQALVEPEREAPFRVLIVEDDRAQALFAEGILRNAGMDSLVVLEALSVMPALEQFQPDLVLMDIHMPDANGIELTALIREHEAFVNMPIVFLSGESDEDRQFDAIEAGGDDFLAKPIRPRYLISSVQNRIRRHRSSQNQQRIRHVGKDVATGLYDRGEFLALLEERMAVPTPATTGGVLFLEIESVNQLRERLGLSSLEQLLGDVSRLLTSTINDLPITRFGDGSYLVLDGGRDENALESLAVQIRNTLVQKPFQVQGHPLRLRLSVGICAFKHGFQQSGALLNVLEKVARDARNQERGVLRYEPPKASEAHREAALLAQIRLAVSDHHLHLLYQPVVAVAGSGEAQYQVLLRLRDANGKLLPAAEVIPMAERSDFIVDIDRWVTMQALALIRERIANDHTLRLFVTQSALTLADSAQATWLKSELETHSVPGTSLVIELRLEDVAVHAATVRQFCEEMVTDGVQFCLSQYEAGEEAEALLEQLPLGFVKLSRKYTAGNPPTALRDELRLLIERAHRRGLEVIGHGVEDAQSAATLWMSGIDYIQGNLVQEANSVLDFNFNQAVL